MKELKTYIEANRKEAESHLNEIFDFDSLGAEDLFYKAVFCILVPGGKASRTSIAVEELRHLDLFNTQYSKELILNIIKSKVRFPNVKADRLLDLNKDVLIAGLLFNKALGLEGRVNREWLVDNINGFGYKASSHFLRNLGYTDLAIIDTHVLKYRKYFMPEELQTLEPKTKKKYLQLEEHFIVWAEKEFKLNPILLDWLIWTFEGGYKVNEFEY